MALNIIVVTEKLVEIHHGYTQRKNSVNINPEAYWVLKATPEHYISRGARKNFLLGGWGIL